MRQGGAVGFFMLLLSNIDWILPLFPVALKTSSYSFKIAISLTPFQQSQLQVKASCVTPRWNPSWLSYSFTATKDPESGQLGRDNPETNHLHKTRDFKPCGRIVLLGSLTLLLSAWASLRIMSLALSGKNLSQLYYSLYHYMINFILLSLLQE